MWRDGFVLDTFGPFIGLTRAALLLMLQPLNNRIVLSVCVIETLHSGGDVT